MSKEIVAFIVFDIPWMIGLFVILDWLILDPIGRSKWFNSLFPKPPEDK